MSLRVHAVLIRIKVISTISILAEIIYEVHQYSVVDAPALRDAHTAHMTVGDLCGARRACLMTWVAGVFITDVFQLCHTCPIYNKVLHGTLVL
jgi:hypothetical protein